MQLPVLLNLLNRVRGATFASIDTETINKHGLRCVSEGERIILFATKGGSGYEAKVKRHLIAAGKDPDGFSVGTLFWGERVNNLPLIRHKGHHYLQTIVLSEGKKAYFVGHTDVPVPPERLEAFGHKKFFIGKQDLPSDDQVIIKTFDIRNIRRIVMMGEEVSDNMVAEDGGIVPHKKKE